MVCLSVESDSRSFSSLLYLLRFRPLFLIILCNYFIFQRCFRSS